MRGRLISVDRPVTLVALAPQTNLALLLRAHAAVRSRIQRIVAMGGDLRGGQEPEFNLGHDPEAASEVLASGLPIVMYPYDIFAQVTVSDADMPRSRGTHPRRPDSPRTSYGYDPAVSSGMPAHSSCSPIRTCSPWSAAECGSDEKAPSAGAPFSAPAGRSRW